MPQRPLPANKIRQLLRFSFDDNFNKTEIAKGLRIARSSATKYIKGFKSSLLTLTDVENVGSAKLAKLLFSGNSHPTQSDRKVRFLDRIESVHSRIEHDRLSILDVWREEVATQPPGYRYTQFSSLYAQWRIEQGLRRRSGAKRKAVTIKPIDVPVLKRWCLSRDRRKWEVAIALLNSSVGISTFKTAEKIGRARRIVEKWYSIYERDQAFLEHPRRAGNKIWGKERVEAVFREENNCKDHLSVSWRDHSARLLSASARNGESNYAATESRFCSDN